MTITLQSLVKTMCFIMLFVFIAIYFQNCARPENISGDGSGSTSFTDEGSIPSDGFGACFRGEACTFPPQATACFDLRDYYELTTGVFCHRQVTTTTLGGN